MAAPPQNESGIVARELQLSAAQVQRTLELLDEGNTVAFITRYRKDQTHGLDEEQIQAVRQAAERLRVLTDRKSTILKSIQSQGKLTDDLQSRIEQARSIKRLEDLYLPYKPKKQTLATQARQRGLEPLANEVLRGDCSTEEFAVRAQALVQSEQELHADEDVYQGVGHLIAEVYSEDVELRSELRRSIWKHGRLAVSAVVRDAGRGKKVTDAQLEADEGEGAGGQVKQSPVANLDAQKDDSAEGVRQASALKPASSASEVVSAETGTTIPKNRRKKKNKEDEAFSDYFDFRESIQKLPPHRILAINRGEKAKVLKVKFEFDHQPILKVTQSRLIPEGHPNPTFLEQCLRDAITRLVIPSLEREVRRELTEKAESHAVRVFAQNLRHLLLQRPVVGHAVLAIDPGYKSGCKIAVLNSLGSLVESQVIYVIGSSERQKSGRKWLVDAIRTHGVSVIAIGNGTASRVTEELVASVLADELKDVEVAYAIVNEAGASIYSTSVAGREELPDLDATIRSAVSIGRRLLDPLSELVKISPEHLGVGMYQHDIKAKHLRESLDDVVGSCVNYVGVDANSASPALLKYVSGLNQLSARRFVEYRSEHGPFQSREQFRKVAGFGEATFIQAAGFLKINDPDNILDATWIHPESYELVEKVLDRLSCTTNDLHDFLRSQRAKPSEDLVGTDADSAPEGSESCSGDGVNSAGGIEEDVLRHRLESADVKELAQDLDTGELLVKDLLTMLKRPGRDPRDSLPSPAFRTGAARIDDLEPGMALEGRILNVVDFGVFVDIGISESGLVHISRLARGFVKDPHQAFAVGEPIKVWVVEVDKQRRRVSLTAIDPALPLEPKQSRQRRPKSKSSRAKPANETRNDKARGQKPERGGASNNVRRKRRPVAPAEPLNPEVAEGKSPMRSFTELRQFYEHKKHES